MRLVRRDRRAILLRHRWKYGGSALFIGALMVFGACIAGMSDDVDASLDMSAAAGSTLKQTSATGSRRLGYPPDYLIGRWTDDGRRETFEQVTIFDPRYPHENRTKEEYVGKYKNAPAQRKLCIVVHIIGVMYMLVGLNTVCDLYFCGALDEMVEKWQIPPDVAGATLMAAGGSAPELFTSIIGAIITESDVGFSTIVGSAVFNVLAVIGCCGMAAKDPIKLTWWPLFRDCSFYIISLFLLAVFASGSTYSGTQKGPDGQICDPQDAEKKCGGGKIKLYEAIVLFIMYLIYCSIAYFNENLQGFAQSCVDRFNKESTTQVQPFEDDKDVLPSQTGDAETRPSKTEERRAVSMSVAVRLAVPTLSDNETRPSTIREDTNCHHIRHTTLDVEGVNGRHFRRAAHHAHIAMGIAAMKQGIRPSMASEMSERSGRSTVPSIPAGLRLSAERARMSAEQQRSLSKDKAQETSHPEPEPLKEVEKTEEPEEGSDGSDDIRALIYPPEELKDQVQWALCLPVCAPMYFLIPRPENYFLATFFISLAFIAFFSYWLVYCVQMFSDAILGGGNSVDVAMGFTLLAAGTSIPDLVSSMVVARAGEGDMAVSSSIGSNIFDILVGLPIPWIIKIGIIEMGIRGESDYGVTINSPYIFLYVILLLFMVTCVICSILIRKWYLDRTLGFMMGFLYFVFLAIVIPLELFQYI